MRKTTFLTSIAIFATLFACCGNSTVGGGTSNNGSNTTTEETETSVKLDITKFAIIKTLEEHSDYVTSVCWSPDGKYLASGSGDKTVKIWDANSGACLQTLEEHADRVNSVSWSPDGKYLSSSSHDGTIIIWSLK